MKRNDIVSNPGGRAVRLSMQSNAMMQVCVCVENLLLEKCTKESGHRMIRMYAVATREGFIESRELFFSFDSCLIRIGRVGVDQNVFQVHESIIIMLLMIHVTIITVGNR